MFSKKGQTNDNEPQHIAAERNEPQDPVDWFPILLYDPPPTTVSGNAPTKNRFPFFRILFQNPIQSSRKMKREMECQFE